MDSSHVSARAAYLHQVLWGALDTAPSLGEAKKSRLFG